MPPAFVDLAPCMRPSSQSLPCMCRQTNALRCAPRRRLRAIVPFEMVARTEGWAETRLTWADRQVVPNPKDNLPGVHFARPPRITAQDLLDIIYGRTPDAWVNEIVRSFLGWRQLENGKWSDEETDPRWREKYNKGPPNFIGTNGDYRPEVDMMVKLTVQNLSRSVPPEHKQILKEVMRPLGFPGWKVSQLTPNLTRRAQCVNWILYWYRVHYPEYVWSL